MTRPTPRPVRPELETRMRRAALASAALILACAVLGGAGAFTLANHLLTPKESPCPLT